MRTKTATQRDQDRLLLVDLTTGDGDVEGSGDGDAEGEDKEEEGFSGMLADAILKRPESIRDGSFRSMRKDSRGKLANGNGNAVGGVNKGEINLNEDGDSGGEREEDEDRDGDGWIREPPPANPACRPIVNGDADGEGS